MQNPNNFVRLLDLTEKHFRREIPVKELARQLGWSRATVYRVRKAGSLTPQQAADIAALFGADETWVARGKDYPITPDGQPWKPDHMVWVGGQPNLTLPDFTAVECLELLRCEIQRGGIHGYTVACEVFALTRRLAPEAVAKTMEATIQDAYSQH